MKKQYMILQQILILLLLSSFSFAQAKDFSLLDYQALLPVESYSSEDREKTSLTEGLKQVLVKLSANLNILQHPNVIEALKKPKAYLLNYSYDTVDIEQLSRNKTANTLLVKQQESSEQQSRLQMVELIGQLSRIHVVYNFDSEAINRLLDQSHSVF